MLVVLGIAAVIGLVAMAATTAQAGPYQQQLQCTWKNIGSSNRTVFHVATALDTDANRLYIYGGVNEQFQTQSQLEVADLSGATLRANHAPIAVGGARSLVGAAGAYRAKGADNDLSAAYFFGGINDPASGNATNDVQRYLTKTRNWEVLNPAGTFTKRAFAAAAYDPVHDVIWVTGGIGTCKLNDVLAGQPCNATTIDTQYLSFDPATGEPKWNTLTGGGMRLFGHAMAYDPTGKRLLIYGGTTNITSADNALRALDLSDPDPAKAKLSTIAVSGTRGLYFHGAAFDSDRNWLVLYGGTTQNFMQANEATNTSTYAIDFSKTPPVWTDLRPATSPGDRVGGGMVYLGLHKADVFVLGRKKLTFNQGTPQASTQKTTYGLECQEVVVQPTATTRPGGGDQPIACRGLDKYVPQQVINDALANPSSVQGYGARCYPSQPPSPYNLTRHYLSLRRPVPYHPLFNGLIYKCGCP